MRATSMLKKPLPLGEDLRRRVHDGVGDAKIDQPAGKPYRQFSLPPPCVMRGDVPFSSWNGW